MANTNSRLSDRENEEIQSGGQTFDTSSQRTDVANTERKRLEGLSEQSSTIGKQDERLLSRDESSRGQTKRTDVANADDEGSQGRLHWRQNKKWQGEHGHTGCSSATHRQPTQNWWQSEPDVGRVAHGVSGRVHRLRALGNSIVPQIAEEIGRAIMAAEAEDVKYQSGGAYKAMLKLFRDNLK